ncbi:MAG: glucuronate isomerase [Bacteroidota bacterium]|nr:glucuronate isomerase [Bacteroidota bacterium]
MIDFLDHNFLLNNEAAKYLYHEHAAKMPIIDYHCHLSPAAIAHDHKFKNLTSIWLEGDHYKWRAMRANGVDERFCTGNAPDFEKFKKWAETVPYLIRNPLFHWTYMELKTFFGTHEVLNKESAKDIYDVCTERLQSSELSVKNIIRSQNVEVICTTDDPLDSLAFHQKIKNDAFEVKVLPTFRPDRALAVENLRGFGQYLENLEEISNIEIYDFKSFIDALETRHTYFHEKGCRLSDHGLERLYSEDFTDDELVTIFKKIKSLDALSPTEIFKFKSAVLYHLSIFDYQRGWVQQFHIGALRNNNIRMLRKIGPDAGFDSIGDYTHAKDLSGFFSRLDENEQLAKTILYNLNPADNEIFAAMAGNFNDGVTPGKMQYGAAWWFLDQKEGMERQMNTLSNLGLISRFIGMTTDSRSFLSYSRHEYFRRILCNMVGKDIEAGEIPNDLGWAGKIIRNICYYNALNYFNFPDHNPTIV